ncbi:MAG: hypothetical protein V4708_17435 [Bacteroidota bacterium]
MIAPSEISFDSLINDVDFEKHSEEKTYYVSSFKQGKKPLRVLLSGVLTCNNISVKTFDNGPSYSFGMRLSDEEDIEALRKLTTEIDSGLEKQSYSWEVADLAKEDGLMYVKIPYNKDKDKFTVKCNLKLIPKKIDELELYRGQEVKVQCSLGAWYNYTKETAGVYMDVSRIDFEEDEPTPKKRKDVSRIDIEEDEPKKRKDDDKKKKKE